MHSQQLYDLIIKPTHEYMCGNYESKNANFLSLCTAAIESNCGYYIKQIGGPALGVWQMEPDTLEDIGLNCDALRDEFFLIDIEELIVYSGVEYLISSPMYACAMARLKYSMDLARLLDHNNIRDVYDYYKRIYNTPAGASTFEKFEKALLDNKILEVVL